MPTVVDLFSGAGGFHIGFEQAGFEVKLCVDIDKYCEEFHKINFPHIPFIRADIREVSNETLRKYIDKDIDVLIGGPPCQGFSTIGSRISPDPIRRKKIDPRNELFKEYIRILKFIKPKFFIMENVLGLLTKDDGNILKEIKKRFEETGYKFHYAILNAADYGVPQIRKRVFFFGNRLGIEMTLPEPKFGENKEPYRTVGWAISDLASKENEFKNHVPLKHKPENIMRYTLIPEGRRLPEEELPKNIYRKNFGSTFKRLHRDKPSLTIVPGHNAFPIHPWLNRSLTVREAARIQTFDDKFEFCGPRDKQCMQVGNAVPPQLARAWGEYILDILSNYQKCSKYTFVDLFSGAGGFLNGFLNADFEPIFSIDNWKPAIETHKENFPNVKLIDRDITSITDNEIIKYVNGKQIDVVIGGPPCQGFSTIGKRILEDKRNKLIFEFIRFVRIIQPKFFLMENVRGLLSAGNGEFVRDITKEFEKAGYSIKMKVLCAADYGIPQMRYRTFFLGRRTDISFDIDFPAPTSSKWNYATVGQAIMDLVGKENQIPNHIPISHNEIVRKRIHYIPEGGGLPENGMPEYLMYGSRSDYKDNRVKNFSHVYRRLHRDKPSTTMVPGHNAFPLHPTEDRALTVREAARIQTFDDSIIFQGSRQEQCILVGNAVPVKFAEILARQVKKYLNQYYSEMDYTYIMTNII